MDRRLLRYYERELAHLRKSAGEYAREFPKIAKRLELDESECPDPYVERLLEGFAFMAARVQLKLDAEFPRFTQHLLEAVYPQYLAPLPSMCIAQYTPDYHDAALAPGLKVPRGTAMRSTIGKGERTACEFRTGHEITLLPLRLTEAQYYTREIGALDLPGDVLGRTGARSALRVRLEATAGLTFAELALTDLSLHFAGSDQTPMRLHELLLTRCVGVVVRPPGKPAPWTRIIPGTNVTPVGYEDEQALLPLSPRSFHGYRLLHEYFALPQRYLFADVKGLGKSVKSVGANAKVKELDLIFVCDQEDRALEGMVSATNTQLFCVPAINLFPRRADRIHVSDSEWEYHVVPDRTRPMDYEIFDVLGVEGYGEKGEEQQRFRPFYAASDFSDAQGEAYFALARRPRSLTEREKRKAVDERTGTFQSTSLTYHGSEVFVSIVDSKNAPFRSDLRQLGVEALCTNRHLPVMMPLGPGAGRTDFTTDLGPSVQSVRVLGKATRPRESFGEGETAWRLISHLSLNYLSLVDASDERVGAAALRDLLRLYADASDPVARKQVDGVRTVTSRPIVRRVSTPGPIAFARGLEIEVTLDDAMFEGTGIHVLGGALERFFSKYVSINSFTETILRSSERGVIKRWAARIGQRSIV